MHLVHKFPWILGDEHFALPTVSNPDKNPVQPLIFLFVRDSFTGLSLSFDAPVALILTPVTNLLLYG